MKLTEQQHLHLKAIWKSNYPPKENEYYKWLDWISQQESEKDIKNINSSLEYFQKENIQFKDTFLKILQEKINKPNSPFSNHLPNFSFLIIFKFLKVNNLIKNEDIPMNNFLNGVYNYYHHHKKSRFELEHQIKFLLLFNADEKLVNKLLDIYLDIHTKYTIDIAEQKKVLKLFNSYTSDFFKTIDDSKKNEFLDKINFICSGLNNESIKDISIKNDDEFAFKFTVSINNLLPNAFQNYIIIVETLNFIMKNISDEKISGSLLREVNNQTKLGVLKIEHIVFSKNKECIDKYKSYFDEFNSIITNNILNKNTQTKEQYLELFKKIEFKGNLTSSLQNNNNITKRNKI